MDRRTIGIGSDVVVDLTGDGEHSRLHYGTVYAARLTRRGPAVRVSGLPRQWIPRAALAVSPRPAPGGQR